MNTQKLIVKRTCQLVTLFLGRNKRCICYKTLGQTALDLLDEAFNIHPSTGDYERNILTSTKKWLGVYDNTKCRHFADFINKRFCTNVLVEEVLECQAIDDVAKLINENTGCFFPKYCKYCVDK